MHSLISRRRALTMFAATAAVAAAGWPAIARTRYKWTGVALGADARIIIDGLDHTRASAVVSSAVDEIERLEQVFSLYRPTSELTRLNADGRLGNASHDLRVLLDRSLGFWRTTDGAFNPAIQPLWRLLASHFATAPASEAPSPRMIEQALRLCDPAMIRHRGGTIALAPGMALTFNGVAQGYITDVVAALLMEEGLTDILIDLGELRALPGRAWDIADAGGDLVLSLRDRAVATSAGSGTPLSADGRWHHLIDPRSGLSPGDVASITVTAPTATEADAVSTALFVAGADRRARILSRHPRVRLVNAAHATEEEG